MPDGSPADILQWWKLRDHSLPADPTSGRPEGLPRLARMARQYHGEPASSAGAERLFSKASTMHHDLKGAMADNSLEHALIAIANNTPNNGWGGYTRVAEYCLAEYRQ